MGQGQNGLPCIKYRSSSQKNKAEECKSLQTTSLPLHSSANLSQSWKTISFNLKISVLFVFLLFILCRANLKTIWRMQIWYMPNDCSAIGYVYMYLPFLVWGGVWATVDKLQPWNSHPVHKTFLLGNFSGLCLCILSVARIARPHPDYWMHVCITGCDEFTSNELCVNKSLTIVSLFTWFTWKPFSPAVKALAYM